MGEFSKKASQLVIYDNLPLAYNKLSSFAISCQNETENPLTELEYCTADACNRTLAIIATRFQHSAEARHYCVRCVIREG